MTAGVTNKVVNGLMWGLRTQLTDLERERRDIKDRLEQALDLFAAGHVDDAALVIDRLAIMMERNEARRRTEQ